MSTDSQIIMTITLRRFKWNLLFYWRQFFQFQFYFIQVPLGKIRKKLLQLQIRKPTILKEEAPPVVAPQPAPVVEEPAASVVEEPAAPVKKTRAPRKTTAKPAATKAAVKAK